MRYLKYVLGVFVVFGVFLVAFGFNYIGNSREQAGSIVSVNDASRTNKVSQIDPKQLLVDLGVFEHWYVAMVQDYGSNSEFDYTLKAIVQGGDEYSFKLHSLGTPTIYIRPYASIFAQLVNKDSYSDLQVAEIKSMDPKQWGVDSTDIDIVSFKTEIYSLPGAKVPYDLLNPVYAGIRTGNPVSFYNSPSIDRISEGISNKNPQIEVMLYYAKLADKGSLLIREVSNIYDTESSRLTPLHCFDFVYENAKASSEVPVKALLKIYPDRRPLQQAFHKPPPMGNDMYRSPGGVGVNYEYAFEYMGTENPGYFGKMPIVNSVTVVEDPLPDFYGPNSIFIGTTKDDRIVKVSIEGIVKSAGQLKMSDGSSRTLNILRTLY